MFSPRIRLAQNGPEFSRIVLGLWRLAEWQMTPQERLALLQQSIEIGVTTIDHADIYGDYRGEALFGEALALSPQLRHRMKVVSKCGIKLVSGNRPTHSIKHYDTSRAHILASVDNSLAALRTDYLDLLLIHRPDPLMEADEIAAAFQTLRQAGKVRHFGVSNFTPAQFNLLHARVPLVTNQIELSPLHLSPLHDGTLDQSQQLRIAPMVWSALAGGRLFTEDSPRAQGLRAALGHIAAARGVSPTTVAYAWILRHPSRPLVLTGSRRIEATREAVAATELQLTREEWFSIWTAAAGQEVP
jgi:predicted oxidoreductase